MEEYFVSLPITGVITLRIKAESGGDAIQKAIDLAEKEEILGANPNQSEKAMGYEVNYVKSTPDFTKRRNSVHNEEDYKRAWAEKQVEDSE